MLAALCKRLPPAAAWGKQGLLARIRCADIEAKQSGLRILLVPFSDPTHRILRTYGIAQ